MIQPRRSWVAKWQRFTDYHPGIYCVSMHGDLPEIVDKFLEERKIQNLSKIDK
jgi:transcription elongation factor SPT4